MNLDPIDFFPGYDPCLCYRQRTQQCGGSMKNICSHLLAMLITIGMCASAFYYYETYKNGEFNLFQKQKPIMNKKNSDIEEFKKEMDKIKEALEDTNNWRKQLTALFTNIYVKQETTIIEKIDKALDIYDSDKIGMFDYAATYACGSIMSTPDTFPYPANKSLSFFNLITVDLLSNPEAVLQPANLPGNCFAFYGSTGKIRIKLGKRIPIKAVTLDHIKLIEEASSAPKEFEVFGLYNPLDVTGVFLGRFTYDIKGRPYQTFSIHPNHSITPFEYVELTILNNYGRHEFTCVYRFRVHNMDSRWKDDS